MKNFNPIILLLTGLFFLTSCDEGFEELNKSPYQINEIEPNLLFANALRQTAAGSWEAEQTVTQQFLNAYNTGATAGHNFNEDTDNFNTNKWGLYGGSLKIFIHLLNELKDQPEHANMYNIIRIWSSHNFMNLVDTHGHVPYSEAGLAFLQGLFYPKYDRDSEIYESLYNEIKAAAAALNPSGDFIKEDVFFGHTGNAANQTAQWKKAANSLLLRLGMRYSKLDPAKARTIVNEAVAGGVMQTNADNVYLSYPGTTYNNPLNGGPRGTNPYFYYVAEPFVDFLKNNNDPRMEYIVGKYSDPNSILALKPNTDPAIQFGFPVGYDQNSVKDLPGYRGTAGTGQNYSQLNYEVFGSAVAPMFWLTNAQTKLLLAEAAHRGWITGSAQQYYEDGVKASMDEYNLYPNTPDIAVTDAEKAAYLAEPGIAWTAGKELELINTQYWVVSLGNGLEAWSNFRRTGFPTLTPNAYNDNLNGGFVRRFPYPNSESSTNPAAYQAAVGMLGGPDFMTTRIFWDIP